MEESGFPNVQSNNGEGGRAPGALAKGETGGRSHANVEAERSLNNCLQSTELRERRERRPFPENSGVSI